MPTYREFYRRSIDDPEGFWTEQAKLVDWHKPFGKVLDYASPPFRSWFVGGETNLCHNAIDRHLATRAGQKALVWISTEVDEKREYTYRQLADEVNRFAAILKANGVGRGDRVLIYMPMIPEAVFAMLATVRIGAIHSVVFGGFAAASLAARIDDARPKVLVTSDAGMRMGKMIALKPLVDESIRLSKSPPSTVILHDRHRLGGGALVHRLCPAHQRLDHDHVRGRADSPRRGHLVEDRPGLRRDVDVHVADRDPRAEEAGPGVHAQVRHPGAQVPLP